MTTYRIEVVRAKLLTGCVGQELRPMLSYVAEEMGERHEAGDRIRVIDEESGKVVLTMSMTVAGWSEQFFTG